MTSQPTRPSIPPTAAIGGDAPSSIIGLDKQNNPITSSFVTDLERLILKAPPLQDVDWRGIPKLCHKNTHLRAAYVQRAGTLAPQGEACRSCENNCGPFATCRTLVVDGIAIFGGACANCTFHAGGHKCSYREALPNHVLSPLKLQNPDHPLLKGRVPPSPVRKRVNSSSPGKAATKRSHNYQPSILIEDSDSDIKEVPAATASPKKTRGNTSTPKKIPMQVTVPKKEITTSVWPKETVRNISLAPFKGRWLISPLDDPPVSALDGDFTFARRASREIPAMIARLQSDAMILKDFLAEHNQTDTPVESEEEEAPRNRFYNRCK
ncbi:uncharacterized protein N7482_007693 [Penicillium canariense]|uniref:Uncharacterized protein n=1 Tax=Penicillium canariense TaxID=189055 RepID=A0A9W9HYL1_9EURO|nr:uncharacterized protein N7482_007693 [Penicillium canariense]KAJ5160689.1 hypothetical protein N7482_007693 [Penicillium canariense]